jgi:curli production assembly/transport component CsgF
MLSWVAKKNKPILGMRPMNYRYKSVMLFCAFSGMLFAVPKLAAQELTFEFNNPSFGGNPFNSAHLVGVANAQNNYKDPAAIDRNDPSAQFLRTLQSRLLSAVANQISELIFGENAQDSGLIRFGDQEVSFVRGIDGVTLTITNLLDGSVTEIIVPLLTTPGG